MLNMFKGTYVDDVDTAPEEDENPILVLVGKERGGVMPDVDGEEFKATLNELAD